MKMVDVIRWVALAPLTVISAYVAGALVFAVLGLTMRGCADSVLSAAVFYCFPAVMAVAWVSASYHFAPSHHLTVVWVSFLCGALLAAATGWIGLIAIAAGWLATMFYSRQVKKAEACQS